jgi:2-polyprenyl-3-methyl-5-hydroxy-6-metoxy-1,4-benzoquinol methylase
VSAFDEFFGADYLFFWSGALTEERSDREAELAWSLLELAPGMEVLDLACGQGRLANRLAARGARVTGLDSSTVLLERARADAEARGVEVDYVEGDMRSMPWQARFDAVLNWFTAFGYHPDDELRAILRGVHGALRPGGRFVLETISVTALMARFRAEGVTERDGDFMIEQRRYVPARGGVATTFTMLRGSSRTTHDVFIRMPTYTELRDWLLEAGFTAVAGYGEDGEPLGQAHRRVVAVAKA